MPEMTIGRLSARVGVNVETIRYYERIGLMPAPPRTSGGQRRYDMRHLHRLFFLRRCRELGFPQDEVRAMLTLVDGGDYGCDEIRAMTSRQLDAVRRRIADLRVMEETLDRMVRECAGGNVPKCPIVDHLFAARDG